MGCNLQKMETYDVGRVVRDNDSGTVTAQLIKPPVTCPDGSFNSKKAEVRIAQGMNPVLMFDRTANKAVIVVPNESYVTVLNPGHGPGFFLMTLVFILAAVAGLFYLFKRREAELQPVPVTPPRDDRGRFTSPSPSYNSRPYEGSRPVPRAQAPQPIATPPAAPAQAVPQTVVVNNGNNDGLLTGMMIGSMMSDRRERDVIVEREVIREPARRDDYVSDAAMGSNDADDSYSSDSGSDDSYSSDSSDSYSSDSSSDSFSDD